MTEPLAPIVPATQGPTHVSRDTLDAILARHGLQGRAVVPLSGLSAGNSIYLLGEDMVLRVPHERPDNLCGIQTALAARTAISVARAVGVRTPAMVAFDDTRDLIAVPYSILERVPGEALSRQRVAPAEVSQVWRELGHDLALLHSGVSEDGPAGQLGANDVKIDPRTWLEELLGDGLVLPGEEAWLRWWLDELEALVYTGEWRAFCHGDVNADNVIVRPQVLDYLALVDWDGAGWMDPVWDFVPVSLLAVPYILEGYRSVSRVSGDATAEARILWHHVQYTLFSLSKRRSQGRDVVEQGLHHLRMGISELLKLPGATWLAEQDYRFI